MPRKKSALPPATRVRENQRRSRARRKELIEDLQGRLRGYEEKELQATLAIQLAARRVAWENAQLRCLLASYGASPEKITSFLRDREHIAVHGPSNVISKGDVQSVTTARDEDRSIEVLQAANCTDQIPHEPLGQESGIREQRDSRSTKQYHNHDCSQHPTCQLKGEVPRLGPPTQELKRVDPVQRPDSAENNCGCDAPDQPSVVDAEQNSMLPTLSDCFCPVPSSSSSFGGEDPTLEMSCETAAGIISSMRGNGDREQIRWQLGCKSYKYCNVKTLEVLQVMEMD